MVERREVVVAVGWSALMALAVMLAFALGQLSANTGRAYREGYEDAIGDVAKCTLADARAERCFIPCSANDDCMEKNGQTDH
jgi:ferric-dicitrate binding protein FerR (iron transport regulator)